MSERDEREWMDVPMEIEFTLRNMRNVLVLDVKNPLGMLNDGASIIRNEERDWLRKAILRHECSRLSLEQLLTLSGRRRREKVGVGDGDGGGTGVINLTGQFLGPLGFGVVEFDIDKVNLSLFSVLTPIRRGEPPLAVTTYRELDQLE